jgi:hypothetical protein
MQAILLYKGPRIDPVVIAQAKLYDFPLAVNHLQQQYTSRIIVPSTTVWQPVFALSHPGAQSGGISLTNDLPHITLLGCQLLSGYGRHRGESFFVCILERISLW